MIKGIAAQVGAALITLLVAIVAHVVAVAAEPPAAQQKDCDLCPAMVAIPAGSFQMGTSNEEALWATSSVETTSEELVSERPVHTVSLKQFWISATEVTVDQFRALADDTGFRASDGCLIDSSELRKEVHSTANDWRNPGYVQDGKHPVVCVSWSDAQAYVYWLSKRTGKHYHLPSEAEWEYAARGGRQTAWYWNAGENICAYENVRDFAAQSALYFHPIPSFDCNDSHGYTAPVGSFRPNPYGIFDLLGNVKEWTDDCHHEDYTGAPVDGSAWNGGSCKSHVTRGSTFGGNPSMYRASARGQAGTVGRYYVVGVRVVRSDP